MRRNRASNVRLGGSHNSNPFAVSCFLIGSGTALRVPAWQSSVSEQVPTEALPTAITLTGMSYNIARSSGPAIGGIVVASAGALAAFVISGLLYLPLMVALFLWKRAPELSRLPPEQLTRAIVASPSGEGRLAGLRRVLCNSPYGQQ